MVALTTVLLASTSIGSVSVEEAIKKRIEQFNIEHVIARRAINSKNPGATTTEVVIYN